MVYEAGPTGYVVYRRLQQLKAKVTVALARELAGFVWALLTQVPVPKA